MLYIVLKSINARTGKQNEIQAHIPFRLLPTLVNEELDFIQADGDELDAILYTFLSDGGYTIPVPRDNRVVRWYGDIAKTIYFNLR